MYSGGSGLSIDIHFVDIELSYDVLSPLPIVLSKHFNHPHPYIEIATAISDKIFVTSFRYRDGQKQELELRGICITHFCIPRYITRTQCT